MERHNERERDREQVERFHLGQATAQLLTAIAGAVGADMRFDASDVFADLREYMPGPEEQAEAEIRAAMAGWPGARRTHHA